MSAPGLTACLIVRNEAHHLPGCLLSLRSAGAVVAEVCVLDTGSTDQTVQLARAGGARVEEWSWTDDFAAAKNRAADMARTPWVLSIDADERFEASAGFAQALARAEGQAHDALVMNLLDMRGGRVHSTVPVVRVYRPATARFRNRVHEVLAARDGGELHLAALASETGRLRHIGYTQEALAAKRARNLRLADLEVTDLERVGAPAEVLVPALVNRGRAAASGGVGAPAGLDDWLRAWALGADTRFGRWAGELAVAGLVEARRLTEAQAMLPALAASGVDAANLAWLGARVFAAAERPEDALTWLRRAEGRRSAMGETPSDEPVLRARMQAEIDTGRLSDALTTGARLLARYGRDDAVVRAVLVLSGGDAETAVRRLHEVATNADIPDIGDAVRALGDADLSALV